MKLHARNVAWLLPLFLTACFNKPHQTPIQEFAPPVGNLPKPPALHPELPLWAIILPDEPLDTDTDAMVEEAAKPAVRHRRPASKATPESPDSAQSAPSSPQQAENESGEVPAIGTLSSGDPSDLRQADLRQETMGTILDTERGLKGLGRTLNGQEQKTAAQIREFLRQARKALNSGDVDGAHTLAAKAKVLLSELNQ